MAEKDFKSSIASMRARQQEIERHIYYTENILRDYKDQLKRGEEVIKMLIDEP